MNKKTTYLRCNIGMGLFIFLTFLFSPITFAYQNHDLDEFDDLELKSLEKQKKKSDDDKQILNNKQRFILFDDNLYLLDDDFDFGDEEELELLKLELNPDDIKISREYEDFLNAFYENSTLIRPPSLEKSNPPIIKFEQSDPISKNKIKNLASEDPPSLEKSNPPIVKQEQSDLISKTKIENLTPEDSPYLEKSNSPIIKQEQSDPISKTRDVVRKPTENRLSILPRLGLGLNYLTSYNNIGFITGGSISYGNNEWGNIGADLMYIIIKQSENPFLNDTKKHTLGISGFYEKTLFKYIALKGGVGLLKTGTETKIGVAAGAGVSFPIGKILIIQPMARLNFGSKTNNMMGINLNIGISLEKSHLQEMFGNVAE